MLINLIQKFKLKQIETIYWWLINERKSNESALFLGKITLLFIFLININNERRNLFEKLFKSKSFKAESEANIDFFSFIKKNNYDFNKLFDSDPFKDIKNKFLRYKNEHRNIKTDSSLAYLKIKGNKNHLYLLFFFDSWGDFYINKDSKMDNYDFLSWIHKPDTTIEHLIPQKDKDSENKDYILNIGNIIFLNKMSNWKAEALSYREKLKIP